jgi:hypothetical protein
MEGLYQATHQLTTILITRTHRRTTTRRELSPLEALAAFDIHTVTLHRHLGHPPECFMSTADCCFSSVHQHPPSMRGFSDGLGGWPGIRKGKYSADGTACLGQLNVLRHLTDTTFDRTLPPSSVHMNELLPTHCNRIAARMASNRLAAARPQQQHLSRRRYPSPKPSADPTSPS